MDALNDCRKDGFEDVTSQDPTLAKSSRTRPSKATSVRRPGGCHALRPAHRPGPAGASAEDWLKAIQ